MSQLPPRREDVTQNAEARFEVASQNFWVWRQEIYRYLKYPSKEITLYISRWDWTTATWSFHRVRVLIRRCADRQGGIRVCRRTFRWMKFRTRWRRWMTWSVRWWIFRLAGRRRNSVIRARCRAANWSVLTRAIKPPNWSIRLGRARIPAPDVGTGTDEGVGDG